ncbi:hypothetical protein BAUCODRAFT_150392 [Baudoinia panamericana UAMH 10762]|uniref:TMEM205-like domain-containing protein n=1 Tax=Baudoinia panamericana (strain UAMH 10762) TaxID=717646 RepID=M2MRS4_BAUPA|nr:uncharacterized protein BAUCODRAFT_150392 [Baudoinia panamericana UAMH 10762]EMC94193.1 hypothetical protein BAUCODRAFT_150392 [Baudoinia panamericana UAMH 10762]
MASSTPKLPLFDHKTIHLLAYAVLLGSNMQQTLMNGPMGLRVLTRSQFSILQQNIFPPYFTGHALFSFITLATAPQQELSQRSSTLAPVLFHGLLSLANLLYVGPQTIKVLRQRTHQETMDGKKWDDKEQSPTMKSLNRSFVIWHFRSFWMNNVGLVALVYYGTLLARRLKW